jgi:hypothetical protein
MKSNDDDYWKDKVVKERTEKIIQGYKDKSDWKREVPENEKDELVDADTGLILEDGSEAKKEWESKVFSQSTSSKEAE